MTSLRAKFVAFVLPVALVIVIFAGLRMAGAIGLGSSLRDLERSYNQMRGALGFARYADLDLTRGLADGVLPGDTLRAAAERFHAQADSAVGAWRASLIGAGETAESTEVERMVSIYGTMRALVLAGYPPTNSDGTTVERATRGSRLERLLADSLRPAVQALVEGKGSELLAALSQMERRIGQSSPWIPEGVWEETSDSRVEALQVIAAERMRRHMTTQGVDLMLLFHFPESGARDRIQADRREAWAALAVWRFHVSEDAPAEAERELAALYEVEDLQQRAESLQDEILELLASQRVGEAAKVLETAWAPLTTSVLEPLLDSLVSGDEEELVEVIAGMHRIGQRLLWGTGTFSALLLAVGLVLPWLLARTVVDRLVVLTGAVQRVATGEAARPVPVRSNDEIGHLEHGFNAMANAIVQHERALVLARDELEVRVTERTEELAEREELLRLVIDNAGDEVLVWDEEGRFVTANQRACDLLGYTREEMLALRLPDIETRATQTEPIGARLPSLPFGEIIRGEGIQRRKDGTTFPVEALIGPVGVGGRRLYVAIARDVTEQLKVQEALRDARDSALEASRLKSDFLANMSHEIRTPLNGVIGMTSLLLDSDLSPHQREDAEIIRTSAENLLAIINDILDLSRIEAGKLVLEPAPFDLEVLIDEVAGVLAPVAEAKGIEFVVRIAPDTPRRLVGDVTRLRQVLTNLAGNAVKFTERGHVLLDVSVQAFEQHAVNLRVTIEDTGIGIPPERVAKIFEKFEQIDSSIQRRFGGTGLGLPITRHLVEAMGGAVDVASRLGEGSRFWFIVSLPVSAWAEPPTPNRAALKGIRALVVDDNALNRRVVREMLGSWHLRHDEASSPAEGLALLRAAAAAGDPYGIAVLDYDMPEMTGEELAQVLAREEALQGTAVVLLSSAGHRPGQERPGEGAVAVWLVKPARPSQLLDALVTAWRPHDVTRPQPHGGGGAPAPSRDTRVLLVEDNAINQKVARRLLEKLGCSVDVAANGEAAVLLASQSAYEVIFMDCQMPGMDGFTATAEIRRAEGGGRHTPIVALTAHAMEGDRERCLLAGMDDYVAKPVREEDLVRALDHHRPA